MNEKLKEIIDLLSGSSNRMTAHEIAEKCAISPKYVHKLLDGQNQEFESMGFSLDYVLRKGYRLTILNPVLFNSSLPKENSILNGVLCTLLESKDYLKIEELADTFYLSRPSMDRIIKEIKDQLSKYQLTLESKPKYGIKIQGSEFHKRICYASYVKEKEDSSQSDSVFKVQRLLYTVLKKENYSLSDTGFNNLVFHILILMRRIQEGNIIQEDVEVRTIYSRDYEIAKEIVDKIEKEFTIHIPPIETKYIMLHLVGKQILHENNAIDEKVLELVDDIFEEIKEKKNLDFHDNLELRIMISLHIQPMLTRLQYGLKQENPLLDKIKREMQPGFELAIIAKEVIDRKYNLVMDEDEVSYLAMHFALAIEKLKEKSHHFKVLIVCATGRGTSRLLQYQLMSQYHLPEEDVVLSSLFQLSQQDTSEYSCVLSTIPIPFEVKIPVLLIHNNLDESSILRINEFMKKQGNTMGDSDILEHLLLLTPTQLSNQTEALNFLLQEMITFYQLPEQFKEAVLKREELGSTAVGNGCAIPHPFDFFPETPLLTLMVLDKPIAWGNDTVRFVFLCALPKEFSGAQKFNDAITRIVCDKGALHQLEKEPTKETVRKLFAGESL